MPVRNCSGKIFLFFVLATVPTVLFAQDSVTVKEYVKVFPTYGFSDPSPLPLLSPVYPYFRYDGFTDKAQQTGWKVVEIESPYIRLLIMPQIGGKIWAAIDRKTEQPFLYYNHVVKFRDIAMRGPWTSGGLESNFGIIGHTPNCSTPVDYSIERLEDGSITCTIGALDLLTRTNWSVRINVPQDKAFFTTQAFWHNGTGLEQPYYHWMNAAAKAADDLEFIFPGNKYIGHSGEFASWPVNAENGRKISFYRNNDFGGYKSYHVFGKYTNFFSTYYHHEDRGMVRYGTHDDKAGKKIWIWGLSDQGMIWDKLLTDSDGQYTEVQSGRLFNQNAPQSSLTPFKHIAFEPYATEGWTEYWYPVKGTGGVAEASEWGAFNMKQENGWLKFFYYAVQPVDDTLTVRSGSTVLYRRSVHLLPTQRFADSVKSNADPQTLSAELGTGRLRFSGNSTSTVLARPVESPADFRTNTAYGLYLQGCELMDQKMYPQAEMKLAASLQLDQGLVPALEQMAELQYRNLQYAPALKLALRALSINSVAGKANYYYGLINRALGSWTDARDGFDLASLDPAYRSAAYTELASLGCLQQDYTNGLLYANKALNSHPDNITALQLRAMAYRGLQNRPAAAGTLDALLRLDPLNHFARFERFLWDPMDARRQTFLQNIRNELPRETLAELAHFYATNGDTAAARQLFTMALPSPEAIYWLAYLDGGKVDFSKVDPVGYFPFRAETAMVIAHLMKAQPHWMYNYHLALIYHDRNRLAECRELLLLCGDQPGFAPFYAVRAEVMKETDPQRAEADLRRALALDSGWRYYKLLAEHELATGQPARALEVIEPFARRHPGNYITGLLYARALLVNGKAAAADRLIGHLHVLPFEGATESRDLYREAKLQQAITALQHKQFTKGLQLVKGSRQWPATLGVGKPYEADIDARLEDWLAYKCQLGMGHAKEAEQWLQRVLRYGVSGNNERNVYPANALVTAWALNRSGDGEQGRRWLKSQQVRNPEDPWPGWVHEVLEHGDAPLPAPSDSNARLVLRLLKMQ